MLAFTALDISTEERERQLLAADPVAYMRHAFERLYAPLGAAPCVWGFKLFPGQAASVSQVIHLVDKFG